MNKYSGYVEGIPYIDTCIPACKPYEIDFVSKCHGLNTKLGHDEIRVLDLGCGRGTNLLILAEAMPNAKFVGIDFNSDHIDWAKHWARLGGLKNVEFKLREFSSSLYKEVGSFDLVICQGVYSWVSNAVRSKLLECIGQVVAPGGVLQLSWNTYAGYSQLLPLRAVLLESINIDKSAGQAKWAKAFDLVCELEKLNLIWFENNPIGRHRVIEWGDNDLRYLAHEFLNDSWHLTSFNEVSKELSEYGFEFSGDSLYERWLINCNDTVPNIIPQGMEEMIGELAMGVPYRNDAFIKFGSPSGASGLDSICFMLSQPRNLPTVQQLMHQTWEGNGIMCHCIDGPKSVGELEKTCNAHLFSAKIRDEIARGMILRVDPAKFEPDALTYEVDIGTKLEFTSMLSKHILESKELSLGLSCFPSIAIRGGIHIPPVIAQIVQAFCQSCTEKSWLVISKERLSKYGIVMNDNDFFDAVNSCKTNWIPFMLAHNILRLKN